MDNQRLETLKQKYQSVLDTMQQKNVQLTHVHVQDNKLFIGGVAASEQAKNDVWNAIKAVNPSFDDLTADITVDPSRAQAASASSAGAPSGGQKYQVKPGDSLSKISKQFYGDANQYMKIFNANRNILEDPDEVQAGQELTIP